MLIKVDSMSNLSLHGHCFPMPTIHFYSTSYSTVSQIDSKWSKEKLVMLWLRAFDLHYSTCQGQGTYSRFNRTTWWRCNNIIGVYLVSVICSCIHKSCLVFGEVTSRDVGHWSNWMTYLLFSAWNCGTCLYAYRPTAIHEDKVIYIWYAPISKRALAVRFLVALNCLWKELRYIFCLVALYFEVTCCVAYVLTLKVLDKRTHFKKGICTKDQMTIYFVQFIVIKIPVCQTIN